MQAKNILGSIFAAPGAAIRYRSHGKMVGSLNLVNLSERGLCRVLKGSPLLSAKSVKRQDASFD
jgi:hypothetical protein